VEATARDASAAEHATIEAAVEFTDIAHDLLRSSSVQDSLHRAIALSIATVESCESASVLLVDDGTIVARASSDAVAAGADAGQLRSKEGPGLDAIGHSVPFYAGELGDDPRWPAFGPTAAELGVRSALALPLAGSATVGALILYARLPDAFGVMDRARGLLLASVAGFALAVARDHESEDRRAENLQAALVTRELIGQAQGILMERERITADQAFDVLRQASQHLNVKLREVALDLVENGERPDTGTPARS
jgi:hypothetical protein